MVVFDKTRSGHSNHYIATPNDYSRKSGTTLKYGQSNYVLNFSDQTNAKKCSDQNGAYTFLHGEEYEETVLLDKANDESDVIENNASNDIHKNVENGLLSPQLLLLEKRLMTNIKQIVNSQQTQKSSLQISLQMIVAAAILLQGTWFVQVKITICTVIASIYTRAVPTATREVM